MTALQNNESPNVPTSEVQYHGTFLVRKHPAKRHPSHIKLPMGDKHTHTHQQRTYKHCHTHLEANKPHIWLESQTLKHIKRATHLTVVLSHIASNEPSGESPKFWIIYLNWITPAEHVHHDKPRATEDQEKEDGKSTSDLIQIWSRSRIKIPLGA